MENGANAWEFVPTDENVGVVVRNCTELEFPGGEQSLIANLQFPNEQRVYYFEVRLDSLPESTNVAVGVAMRGYPPLRMAGWAKNSVAYHSIDGHAYYSHPLNVCRQSIGSTHTSDTVGVGWRPNSGKMFFAINGAIVCHIRTPWARKRLYPIVSADGPCSLNVNVGARAFVLSYANMRHWSLASTEGARPPPPMYQNVSDSVLLEATPRVPEYPGDPGRPHYPPAYDNSRHIPKETAISIEDNGNDFGVIEVEDLDSRCPSSSSASNLLDDTASLDNVPIILRRDSSDSLASAPQRPAESHRH
ncbi:Protein ssh4 [Coemansia guatemalensis]|uniref:Protein ssh4 n=1 Tax=Coemansia guatemalensis TaxID=2761395 RepID=A0A9W8HVK7_9FUNG|nr:Protein ssh4 [Coemansia guatemalensis]